MALLSSSGERLLVYGAGGHGLVVAEAAAAAGWQVEGLLDDSLAPGGTLAGFPVLGHGGALPLAGRYVIVAVGNPDARRKLLVACRRGGARIVSVAHPRAWISPSARLAEGVYVGPMAAVNALAEIGEGTIVNSAAVVEHHCHVAAYAHVAPGAALGGGASLGEASLLGIGAAVLPRVKVGDRCQVGAGGVVISDIPHDTTVVGVPARRRPSEH